MKHFRVVLLLFVSFFVTGAENIKWLQVKTGACQIHYQETDLDFIHDYTTLIRQGMARVRDFFNDTFPDNFDLFIHPNRNSLDSTWQKDWDAPGFNSECWMVASGIAYKMDILSPDRWKEEACEHVYADREETGNLVTHELIHVYHGQYNVSPDFSEVHGIDWFVEGLAVYASGQCSKERLDAVRKAVRSGRTPETLDHFWMGDLRYGLSGSIVMFIDETYGRTTLLKLLKYNRKSEILHELGTDESELIEDWKSKIILTK